MNQRLTPAGLDAVQGLSQRYGVSTDAVTTLLAAVAAGGGTMAQFYHPELGGGGQWMRGGMTMVGDMFNSRLQSTVSGLCAELSALLGSQTMYEPPPAAHGGYGSGGMASGNTWWPSDLGQPSSSGGQNDARYAYFPGPRRLALSRGGNVTIYDTLDHQIGGVQQQQGGASGSLSFSSQYGTFSVDSLPVVGGPPPPQQAPQQAPQQNDAYASAPAAPPMPEPMPSPSSSSDDIIAAIERLGQLAARGILTDEEFRAKKAELLARL
jgi:putative oligomerization/nucleic acid binding protein